MEMEVSTEDQKVDLVCSDVAHVFEDWSELCKCGEIARHRVIKCDHCGNQFWSRRAGNPKSEIPIAES
jgi:hypothetical protein